MGDLLVPDVSEFQGTIDWASFGADAVVVRLCFGDLAVDVDADRNIEGARRRCRLRGWYCYLIAGRDPAAQADTLCRVLQAHGGLQPGEFIVCDDEEGAGDQSGRVNAFLARCDQVLRTPNPSGEDWWYSGLEFALAHSLPAARGRRIIAAYQRGEPAEVGHDLWQFTDRASVAGIAGPVDCSIFHGSLDDLAHLIGGSDMLDPNDPVVVAILQKIEAGPWSLAEAVSPPANQGEVLTILRGLNDYFGRVNPLGALKAELDTVQAELQGLVDKGVPPANLQPLQDAIGRLSTHLGLSS